MGTKPFSSKLKNMIYKTKSAYSAIGQISYCPNCNEQFPASTLYETLDQHVTACLQNYRPTDVERLRMERKNRKDSKDCVSQGVDGDKDNEEVIQVYVRKWEINQQSEDIYGYRRSSIKKYQLSYNPDLLPHMNITHVSLMKTPIKILYLQQRFNHKKISWKQGCEQLIFNPNTVVTDSHQLLKLNMFRQLKLIVTDDKVQDAGGLLRQWTRMLITGLAQHKIFITNKTNYIQIRKDTAIIKGWQYSQKQQKQYDGCVIPSQLYQLLGMVLAKVLIEKVNIPYRFDYTFLRVLLNMEEGLVIQDFVTFDVGLYRSFRYLQKLGLQIQNAELELQVYMSQQQLQVQGQVQRRKNRIIELYQQLDDLSLTFSLMVQNKQSTNKNNTQYQYQLIKNGSKIPIKSLQQLKQYIKLSLQYYAYKVPTAITTITNSHKKQSKMQQQQQQFYQQVASNKTNKYKSMLAPPLQIISQKFNEILGQFSLGQVLQPEQLEIMFNGLSMQQISIDDWKSGTQYKEPYSSNHKVIKYFWSYVEKMSNMQKARLLKFVTGSQNLPIFGFKNLQTNRGETSCFVIQPMKYDKKKAQFPKAHTCFNRLQLPNYPNQQTLKHGLSAIINNQFDGVWGIA